MNNVKSKIKELSQNLHFDLSNQELTKIEEEYNDIVCLLDRLKYTNVSTIAPTSFVQAQYLIDLNEAITPLSYNQEEVFANCDCLVNEMVVIKNEK